MEDALLRRWLLPCLGVLALAACETSEGTGTAAQSAATLDAWVGASEDELVSAWGPPTSSDPLADGSRILQYLQASERVVPGSSRLFPPQTNFERGLYDRFPPLDDRPLDNEYDSTAAGLRQPGGLVEICRTRFTVAADGTVEAAQAEGAGCDAQVIRRGTG